mgnify:CR=1 FL=1
MATSWNDTAIPYGAVTLTINSVTYIAQNFKPQRGATPKFRVAEDGTPAGSFGIATHPTFTATLQKAITTTAEPPIGQTFAYTSDATLGAETWYITECGHERTAGEAIFFEVSGIKKIN